MSKEKLVEKIIAKLNEKYEKGIILFINIDDLNLVIRETIKETRKHDRRKESKSDLDQRVTGIEKKLIELDKKVFNASDFTDNNLIEIMSRLETIENKVFGVSGIDLQTELRKANDILVKDPIEVKPEAEAETKPTRLAVKVKSEYELEVVCDIYDLHKSLLTNTKFYPASVVVKSDVCYLHKGRSYPRKHLIDKGFEIRDFSSLLKPNIV